MLLSDPASPWTPPALTSFCSSLKCSCRGSTWEDPPGEGTSGEETCSTCSEKKKQREHPQKAAGKKLSCPPHRPRWPQGLVSHGGCAAVQGLSLGWARRWLAGTALSCTSFSPCSPQIPAPIHIPLATSCASTTQDTLRCQRPLHTLGSPAAQGRLAGHTQALSCCC